MNYLKSVSDQLRNLWIGASVLGRVAFVATAVLCLAAIIGVGVWSSRPDFVALAANLGPSEAAEIVSKLDAQGIPNQMNFSGSTVLVPKKQWNRARVLLGDLIGPVPPGFDDFHDSVLGDPTLNHYKVLRDREKTLARTIMRMDAVVKATVHIGRPEPSPFVQEQKATTASVVLELKPGAIFTKEQAAAIAALVASSVDGLDPGGVTVLDTKGRLLSTNTSLADANITYQFEFRRNLEADLASKAELMLAQMLGEGRAVVRVTAVIDFTQSERSETIYDPDIKVKKSELIKTTSRTGIAPGGQGAAGTATNIRGFATAAQIAPIKETTEENETEFETAKNVYTFKEPAGTIKRLTVAAIVDLNAAGSDQQAAGGQQAGVTKAQIEGIIQQAVGFDSERGDQIEVLVSELAGIIPVTEDNLLETQKWEFYSNLARNSSLGLAAVAAFILGLLVIRKMKPITVPGGTEAQMPIDRARMLAELTSHARQNPEAVASIISNWLDESEEHEKTEQMKEAA